MNNLTEFKNWLTLNKNSEYTVKTYYHKLKTFFNEYPEFTQETVNDFLQKRIENKSAPTTINLYIYSFKVYATFLKLDIELPKVKRVQSKIRSYINETELNDICIKLNVLTNNYDKWSLILKFMFYTGLRLKEIVNLKRKDIDLEKNIILVKDTKNGEERLIPFSDKLKSLLENYFKNEQERKNTFNITKSTVKHICKTVKDNFNLKDFHPHTLRHCVSDDTEILTKDGWKKYNELKIDEKIFSYNIQKNRIEQDIIKFLNFYKYNGNLFHLKTSHIDSLLTGEHRNVYKIAKIKQKKLKETLYWLNTCLLSINKIQKFLNPRIIKQIISAKSSGKLSIGEPKAFLLGVLLTDGYISPKKDITISQSWTGNKEKCLLIEKFFIESKLKFSQHLSKIMINRFNQKSYQMKQFRFLEPNKKWIFDWITENNKPRYKLLRLKQNELQALYNGFMLGDGCRGTEFCDQDKEKIDFFRTLCIFINKISNYRYINKHRTYIANKNENMILRNKHITQQYYTGIIWCPTTKNQTWIAKRNETIFITGNSSCHYFLKLTNNNYDAVQKIMGHKNIEQTLAYSRLNDDEIMDLFHNAFKNERKKK